MTNNLVTMCLECRKIRIGDNLWIGKENPLYDFLSKRPNISDGYCPEHLRNNELYTQFRKKVYEKIEHTLF